MLLFYYHIPVGTFKYKGILKHKGSTFNYLFNLKIYEATWQGSETPWQGECPHSSVWLTLWGLFCLACGPWSISSLCRWKVHTPDSLARHHFPPSTSPWVCQPEFSSSLQWLTCGWCQKQREIGSATTFYMLLRCHSKAFCDRIRIIGWTERRLIYTRFKDWPLYNEDSKTLEQVAQKDYRYPIPENIQGHVGQGCEQTDIFEDVPVAEGLDWMTFEGPFQHKVFYDWWSHWTCLPPHHWPGCRSSPSTSCILAPLSPQGSTAAAPWQ